MRGKCRDASTGIFKVKIPQREVPTKYPPKSPGLSVTISQEGSCRMLQVLETQKEYTAEVFPSYNACSIASIQLQKMTCTYLAKKPYIHLSSQLPSNYPCSFLFGSPLFPSTPLSKPYIPTSYSWRLKP